MSLSIHFPRLIRYWLVRAAMLRFLLSSSPDASIDRPTERHSPSNPKDLDLLTLKEHFNVVQINL